LASSANFPSAPLLGLAQILTEDASDQKTVLTAGAAGAKVTSVFALSDDSSPRVITLSVLRSGVNYPIAVVSVPGPSGTNGTAPAVDILDATLLPVLPVDNDGQRYILLEPGDELQVNSGSTVTTSKFVSVVAIGADF
jgi:hypothetical protein